MAETLGSLVDKLTIANLRLWHLEDARRDRALSDQDRLAASDAVSVVNKQRNDLMDEIDEYIFKAAHGQVKLKEPKVKIYKKFKLTKAEQELAERLARTVDAKKRAAAGAALKKRKAASKKKATARKKASSKKKS